MGNPKSGKNGKRKPNELAITRLYDAPLKTVWEAWTDPQQVAQWWGPRGFTLTTHSKDLRSGGSWNYTMHGPDGVDYPNTTKYLEVQEHSRLVYDHGANAEHPALFRVTVVFSEVKNKTKMEMTMTLPTPEAAAEIKKFVKKAGGDGTWDRLAEYLTKEETGKEKFVIHRTFEAPIDVVFEMWTNPKHMSEWLPPAGFTMEFIKADIKQGGKTFSKLTDGHLTMFARAEYLEIVKPDRLIYTQQFCDEKENLSRHPMAPSWPETMLTTVTFVSEDEGFSRVKITWEIQGNATQEELQTFINAKGGMAQGWTGSFDKLENYLAK